MVIDIFKDYACTNPFSHHFSDNRDANPITPDRQLIIPYGGELQSDIFPVYLKCAEGITTQGITTISVVDTIVTDTCPTSNRWMIGLDSNLFYSSWGASLYITEVIPSDKPITIYVRARALGPAGIKFTKTQDTVHLDPNVHFVIDTYLKRSG